MLGYLRQNIQLKKKITKYSANLEALKIIVQRRYFISLFRRKLIRDRNELQERQNRYLSWKSAAYAQKKTEFAFW